MGKFIKLAFAKTFTVLRRSVTSVKGAGMSKCSDGIHRRAPSGSWHMLYIERVCTPTWHRRDVYTDVKRMRMLTLWNVNALCLVLASRATPCTHYWQLRLVELMCCSPNKRLNTHTSRRYVGNVPHILKSDEISQ